MPLLLSEAKRRSKLPYSFTVKGLSRLSACQNRSIMLYAEPIMRLALIRLLILRLNVLTGFIQPPKATIVLWLLNSWGGTRGGLLWRPELPEGLTLFWYPNTLLTFNRYVIL